MALGKFEHYLRGFNGKFPDLTSPLVVAVIAASLEVIEARLCTDLVRTLPPFLLR